MIVFTRFTESFSSYVPCLFLQLQATDPAVWPWQAKFGKFITERSISDLMPQEDNFGIALIKKTSFFSS